MRTLLLFSALSLSTPALAQEDWQRFYPLGVGDTWDYSYREIHCYDDQIPHDCHTDDSTYVRRTVTEEVEVEGQRRAVVAVQLLHPETFAVTCEASYHVWHDAVEPLVRAEPVGASCPHAFEYDVEAPFAGGVGEGEWTIGGIPYAVTMMSDFWFSGLSEVQATFGQDLGLIWVRDHYDIGPSGDYRTTTFEAKYARVGGVTYGYAPVASEGEATAPAALGLSVHPNPARDDVALTVALPAPERVTLEVFDALGRRVLAREPGVVAAGESAHRVGLSGLPAGLYVVRATTASGERATRRLVKVE